MLPTNLPKLEPFCSCLDCHHRPSLSKMNSYSGTHPPTTARSKTRRRRMCGGGAPPTPLLHWTFYNNNNNEKKKPHLSSSRAEAGGGDDGAKFSGGRHVELSARKLAAGLWKLRLSAWLLRSGTGGFGSKRRSSDRLRFGPGMGHVNLMLSRNQSSKEHNSDIKHLPRSQSSILDPKPGTFHRHESRFPHSKSLKEEATKWGSRCLKASIDGYCFVSHMKLLELEDQIKIATSVSSLQAELVQAQLYIHDLEYKVRSSTKKVKYLRKKLGEERMSQQKKEHIKIYALIDDLKGQLSRERKRQQKMDVINSRLVKELAEAKLSTMQLIQKYEEEKRTREILEEVCNELAMKIGEDKAEVEALMKIRDEVEEERNMLQMAEVWREERVQMKLIDAKLALESKYSQMNKLITILEAFLKSRSASLDLTDLRKAKLIGLALKSVNIQDMEEFCYEPLRSGDIFSILEELQPAEVCEKKIEPCVNYSSTGDVSIYPYQGSLAKNDRDNAHVLKHSSGFVDYNSSTEEDNRGQKRVDHVENPGSVQESSRSMLTVGGCKNSPNTETSEVCSISAEWSRWMTSSAKLRISCASSGGSYKAVSDEGNGRLSNGTVPSPGTSFLNRKSIKGGLKNQKPMGQCGSMDLVNPHMVRRIKGRIEWPRGIEKRTF